MLLKKSAANSVCTDASDVDVSAADVFVATAPLLLRDDFFVCGVESSPVVSGFMVTGVIDLDLERNNTRIKKSDKNKSMAANAIRTNK